MDNDILFRSPDMWLLHIGHLTEVAEQNLMLYGYIACPGILASECAIDVNNKNIQYVIALSMKSFIVYTLQKRFNNRRGIISKALLVTLLKIFGVYEPSTRLSQCIKDYAGKDWTTSVEVIHVRNYNASIRSDRKEGWFYKEGVNGDSNLYGRDRESNVTPTYCRKDL